MLASLLFPKNRIQDLGKKAIYIHTLLGSTVHSVVAVTYAFYVLSNGVLYEDKLYMVTRGSVNCCHITLGYVLADTLMCIMDPYLRSSYLILLHHLAMIAGILMGLYFELFHFFLVYRFISEMSTPFVNWRLVIYELGDKKGMSYTIASLGMMIVFFLCRVVVIPWHIYSLLFSILLSPEAVPVPMYLKVYMVVNYCVFDFLNSFWFYKMLKGANKVFFLKKGKKGKN